jgi:hypothetical protein
MMHFQQQSLHTSENLALWLPKKPKPEGPLLPKQGMFHIKGLTLVITLLDWKKVSFTTLVAPLYALQFTPFSHFSLLL